MVRVVDLRITNLEVIGLDYTGSYPCPSDWLIAFKSYGYMDVEVYKGEEIVYVHLYEDLSAPDWYLPIGDHRWELHGPSQGEVKRIRINWSGGCPYYCRIPVGAPEFVRKDPESPTGYSMLIKYEVESGGKSDFSLIKIFTTAPTPYGCRTYYKGWKVVQVSSKVPKFEIKYIKSDKEETYTDEPIVINAEIVNKGSASGSTIVDLFINNKRLNQPKTITLAPNESKVVEWVLKFKNIGKYNVCIDFIKS